LVRVHKRDRDEGGQTLIFFVLAMPLFLAIIALVIDGSMLLVKKRSLQNAADAAALAAAQDWPLGGPCVGACLASLQTSANNYSDKNGGPSLHPCNDPDPAHPTDTNCFAAPYVDKSGTAHDGQVEVRLTVSTPTLFTKAVGLKSLFDVSARAVAGSNPILGQSAVPGTTVDGSTIFNTIPGGTHTTTDPGTDIGAGGIGFALSRRCDAIDYGGNPKSALPLGAFATNGGLQFRGNGNVKKITTLYYNQPGCPNNPKSPPSGTSQCTAIAWGDASDSANTCVKTLVDLNADATLPINWPLPPPTPPTPQATAFNASTDYPSKCTSLGSSGTITFTTSGHPPGIYCVSGATTTLVISTGADLTTGDGYTFFALDGAKITYNSNGSKLWFYWPSQCGPRPTTRPASFTCFGRTISGYDPQTVFYATNTTYDQTNCDTNAICLAGQNNQLTGDGFAPKPDDFPPGPTETGGTVFIAGGALAAGSGFFESWMLELQGNTGSYNGTGVPIAIVPGQTHTTTDPSTTQTIIQPGTTNPGTIIVTTIGTDIGLGE
jgi:Putative Flp pilus-assembly TadE/G-like